MRNIIAISALLLVACSDTYRYKCQDPVNHSSSQCQPPVCEASGTCTKYLIKGESNES
jgi:hypothetical protein